MKLNPVTLIQQLKTINVPILTCSNLTNSVRQHKYYLHSFLFLSLNVDSHLLTFVWLNRYPIQGLNKIIRTADNIIKLNTIALQKILSEFLFIFCWNCVRGVTGLNHEFVVMLYWIALYCKVLLFIICVQWVQIKLKINSNVEIKPSVTTKLHFDTPYI